MTLEKRGDIEEMQSLKLDGKQPQIVSGMNRPLDVKPLGLRGRAVLIQVSMVVLANLSILSAGMSLGFPAVTLEQLRDPNQPVVLDKSQASWFASVHAIACPFGGLLSAILLDMIGRKKTIFVINFTAILSWAVLAGTTTTDPDMFFLQIMISRVIIGITTGLASSPVGVYSAEVCHPALRGRLTLGTSISTAGGILAIYVLGYFIRDDWRLISFIACGYSIVATLLTFPVPESPSWLIAKGRTEEAERSLRFFRGLSKDVNDRNVELDEEMRLLMKSVPQHGDPKGFMHSVHQFKRPEVFKPLLIMIAFFAFQQFSGIFVVIVYAVDFSIEAGVSIDPILCAVLVGFTRIITTFVVGYILDKWGRRPPAMISGVGMGVCMLLLAATTWFPVISIKFLPVACIIIYIFTSTLGLMTLPFSMISEVYPQNVRGLAAGLTIFCAYLMSFMNIKLYPSMVDEVGKENVFAFYGVVSLLAVVFIYFLLPETNGKTLHEIEDYFKYGKQTKSNGYIEVEMKEVVAKQ